ncbi:amidase [Mesobacillus campisalis]|uniref:amidase n=1 Tax=Mesobacillus campisalis TaxID=1408103 RepID=UPI0012E269CE|nr:amidase [Mesobacillus campisalis]
MAIVLGIAILSLSLSGTRQYPLATWLWDTQLIEHSPKEVLAFLENQQVKALYLQLDPEMDKATYQTFIQKANEANIQVHALGGEPSWAQVQHRAHYREWQQWIEEYQVSCFHPSQKFAGIHLDVEPYLLPGWTREQSEWKEGYQSLIKEASHFSSETGLSFGVDIPFWWDVVLFKNQYGKGSLAKWVMEHTDFVTIMAYRNYAKGSNGMIDITSSELNWAKELGKPVSIAVETLPQEEKHTTFSTSGLKEMQTQLNLFLRHVRHESAFGGFAIHDLSGWMRLADKKS